MTASLATIALYLRVGLDTSLLHPDQARAWALSVIERMDEPPTEIIDVSWQQPLPQLIADLKSVPGDADQDLACGALLGMLGERMASAGVDLHDTLAGILMVTGSFHDSERFDTFNMIADRLQLAHMDYGCTVQECQAAFDDAMKAYACAPLFP